MLTILKSLMLYFEKSNQPISNIFPKIESALDAFEEIKNLFEDENTNQMYEQIIESIKIYTLNSKEGGLWLLSYLFTPNGLNDLQNRKQLKPRKLGKYSEFENSINIPKRTNEELESQITSESTIQEFYSLHDEINADVEAIELEQHPERLVSRAIEYLKIICQFLRMSNDATEHVVGLFSAYCDGIPYNKFPIICNPFCNTWCWGAAEEIPIYADFIDIAKRISPTPCSESSCERTISLQRLIILANRKKSKDDLVNSRLTLMRSINN